MNEQKIDVFSFDLASGASAATRTFNYTTATDYKRIRGFYLIRNSGTEYLSISISDGSGKDVLKLVNMTHLTVSTSVAIKDRFFVETPIPAAGKVLNINVKNYATTAAIQSQDLIFLYDNQ